MNGPECYTKALELLAEAFALRVVHLDNSVLDDYDDYVMPQANRMANIVAAQAYAQLAQAAASVAPMGTVTNGNLTSDYVVDPAWRQAGVL